MSSTPNLMLSATALAVLTTCASAQELTTPITDEITLDADAEYSIKGNNSVLDRGTINVEGFDVVLTNENAGVKGVIYSGTIRGTSQGKGSVELVSQNGPGLGTGTNTIENLENLTITTNGASAKGITGYGNQHINNVSNIVVQSADDAIHIMGDSTGKVEITNFNNLHLVGENGYGIQDASSSATYGGVNIKGLPGSSVVIESHDKVYRSAIRTQGETSRVLIDATNIALKATSTAIRAHNGTIDLKAENLNIESTKSFAIELAGGELNIAAKKATVNSAKEILLTRGKMTLDVDQADIHGDISAKFAQVDLNGNLVLHGQKAEFGKLSGKDAVITATKSTQNIKIVHNAESLTIAATGSLNDELAGNLEKLVGNENSIFSTNNANVFMEEGMYQGEVAGKISADGSVDSSSVVVKTNSLMRDISDLSSATTLSLNRILNSDLRARMGDVRANPNKYGLWVRYDGGRLASDTVDNDFNNIEVGADALVSGNFRLGAAASYTMGDADYARGSSDLDAYSIAAYGMWLADNGMHADLVARVASVKNDLRVDAVKTGSLDNTYVGLSSELGRRFDLSKTIYVEPQAEVAYAYIDSETLKLSDGSKYEFESVDSLTGRLGIAAGVKCPSGKGEVYVKASLVHEFLGDSELRGGAATYKQDGGDTWGEYGLGAQFNLTNNAYFWADVQRTEGAKVDEDWRASVGLRYAF